MAVEESVIIDAGILTTTTHQISNSPTLYSYSPWRGKDNQCITLWSFQDKEWRDFVPGSNESCKIIWRQCQMVLKVAYFVEHECTISQLQKVLPDTLLDQIPNLAQRIATMQRLLNAHSQQGSHAVASSLEGTGSPSYTNQ